jgi:hypothetical protein
MPGTHGLLFQGILQLRPCAGVGHVGLRQSAATAARPTAACRALRADDGHRWKSRCESVGDCVNRRGRTRVSHCDKREQAGARLITTRFCGRWKPEFTIARSTQCVLSFTAASGRPTSTVFGNPAGDTSTSTGKASIPSNEKVLSFAGKRPVVAAGSAIHKYGPPAGLGFPMMVGVPTRNRPHPNPLPEGEGTFAAPQIRQNCRCLESP